MAYGTIMGQTPRGGGKRYATVVVGTSTAGWTTADCDFLCDGTDDQVEINAAIASLTLSNSLSDHIGEVLLLDGTYNLTDSITPIKSATIRGTNKSGVILKRMTLNGEGTTKILITLEQDSVIENISYDGNKALFTSGGSDVSELLVGNGGVVNNVKFSDCINNAIYAEPLTAGYVVIDNCSFFSVEGNCVYADMYGKLLFNNSYCFLCPVMINAVGQSYDGSASNNTLSIIVSNVSNTQTPSGDIILNGVGASNITNCSCHKVEITNTVPVGSPIYERGRNTLIGNHFYPAEDNEPIIVFGNNVNNCIAMGNILSSTLHTGTIQDNGTNNIKVNNQ